MRFYCEDDETDSFLLPACPIVTMKGGMKNAYRETILNNKWKCCG